MCTSFPQNEAFNTRMNTSSSLTFGTGTSSSQRPGSALAFTTAFIVFNTSGNYPKFSQIHTDSSARFRNLISRESASQVQCFNWVHRSQLQPVNYPSLVPTMRTYLCLA